MERKTRFSFPFLSPCTTFAAHAKRIFLGRRGAAPGGVAAGGVAAGGAGGCSRGARLGRRSHRPRHGRHGAAELRGARDGLFYAARHARHGAPGRPGRAAGASLFVDGRAGPGHRGFGRLPHGAGRHGYGGVERGRVWRRDDQGLPDGGREGLPRAAARQVQGRV